MQLEYLKMLELQTYNAKMKWINRLICTCFLGIIELSMIVGLLIFLSWMRTPPPDITDTKEILTIILPAWTPILTIITGALTWQGTKTHQAGKEYKEYQEINKMIGEKENGKD